MLTAVHMLHIAGMRAVFLLFDKKFAAISRVHANLGFDMLVIYLLGATSCFYILSKNLVIYCIFAPPKMNFNVFFY